MLKNWIHKIALSCEQATLLMELQENQQTTAIQNIRLKLHLIICKYCKIYSKKMKLMNQFFRSKSPKNSYDIDKIETLKERIKQNLK